MTTDPLGPRTTALPDGRRLVVRTATGDDVDALLRLYLDLDADDSHRRFFSVFRPDRAFIERMVGAVDAGGDEIVAELQDEATSTVVGEAGFRLEPDGDGELAIVVARPWRGWLGPYLLAALCHRAAALGVPNLRADVLATNRPMVSMLLRRPWARVETGDLTVLRIVISTTGGVPSWPAPSGRRRLLLELGGACWLGSDELRRAGWEVRACAAARRDASTCPALRGEPCPLVAGADVVVLPRLNQDAEWRAVAAAHARVHPGVRLVADPAGPEELLALLERTGPGVGHR